MQISTGYASIKFYSFTYNIANLKPSPTHPQSPSPSRPYFTSIFPSILQIRSINTIITPHVKIKLVIHFNHHHSFILEIINSSIEWWLILGNPSLDQLYSNTINPTQFAQFTTVGFNASNACRQSNQIRRISIHIISHHIYHSIK